MSKSVFSGSSSNPAFENKPAFSGNSVSLSVATFEKWREFIYNTCGIYFQDNKKYLLESRLLKRLNHLKLNSYEDYLDYINIGTRKNLELKELFEAITINETYFFRNQPQLDVITQKIVPDLIKMKANSFNKKIRIWSAASSSGEEAYSIAILLNEMVKPKFPNFTFEIVGTDISNDVLQRARSGVFKEYSIRNTPIFYLKKYFSQDNNEYTLDPKIKSMVKFEELNLYDDFKMRMMNNFDIIICANVLIYFDVKSKIKVVNHLYNALNKDGFLFIGYSETLHGISKAFQLQSFPKTIAYKKV